MILLNKAFEILDEFDDESNKVLHEDMVRVRAIIWADGLDVAVSILTTSIHPFHSNVLEALRQIHYMMEVSA